MLRGKRNKSLKIIFKKKIILLLLPLAFCFFNSDNLIKGKFFNSESASFIPKIISENTTTYTSSVLTSSDGYDNFYLGDAYAEPHISVNPNNPLQYFVAFNYNSAWFTNDGLNWTSIEPDFGINVTADPVTAYDRSGNLFFQLLYYDNNISGSRIMKSTDNGQSWSGSVTSVSGDDKDWLVADQTDGPYKNYLYSTITNSDWDGESFARSTDGGVTWDFLYTFYYDEPQAGSMIAIGPDGIIHVVIDNGNPYSENYDFWTSTDAGVTWTHNSEQHFANYVGTAQGDKNSVDNMKTMPYPWIAADNTNGTYSGRMYLVYASNDPAGDGNKPDIFSRYSTDNGTTWSSAIKVNDDPNAQNNNQYFPTIWCDRLTGRLFVTWMDTRDAPAADSAYIYATYSDNGAQSFAPNVRLSNQKMKVDCSFASGTPKYGGDYNSIVSINGQGMAAWGDYRYNSFGSFVAYFPDFAVTLSNSSISILNTDSGINTINIPAVLLYSNQVTVSATVSPNPSSGQITFSFPDGNTLNSFPGSIRLQTNTSNVPDGNYTVTVKANGPNGIPVHQRSFILQVTSATPVQLLSFQGSYNGAQVELNWATATEVDNYGFDVERSEDGINWSKIGFVKGNGNSNSEKSYKYLDNNVIAGSSYNYRLKQIDNDGNLKYSGEISINIKSIKNAFVLNQNYPNPFNPATTINYQLAEPGFVTIKLYDISGKEIKTLVNDFKSSGVYSVILNGDGLPSGVYFYKMQSGNFVRIKKLLLLK